MALGSGHLHEVPTIVDTVLALEPRSVLDLGMGTGKYGFLLREQHDLGQIHHGERDYRLRLVGVEGYADYIGDIQGGVYDEIICADVSAFLASCEERFDVALVLDVLEHFEPALGKLFIERALRTARFVVISTPRGFYPQEGHLNKLERHLSWWPSKALRKVARETGAGCATRHDRYSTVAVLSIDGEPRIVDESWRELRAAVRSALLPEVVWCRLRGKAGPTIPF